MKHEPLPTREQRIRENRAYLQVTGFNTSLAGSTTESVAELMNLIEVRGRGKNWIAL